MAGKRWSRENGYSRLQTKPIAATDTDCRRAVPSHFDAGFLGVCPSKVLQNCARNQSGEQCVVITVASKDGAADK